ncbi:zonadhesin [Orycteropus afer afer]|uniref:Zonadhesin n=1 Tax=Orycteropus afer afer TaxID=1230840 RepID=A0AC54ZEJ7_ORYAF|nr:zonadhesin [Orycteropus afer afer]
MPHTCDEGVKGHPEMIKCDFEDDTNPLCGWTQGSEDDGDWTRARGSKHTDTTGPPGGYPNKQGYYLLMDARVFRRGGVARLRSPVVKEPGPLCVHFAYHMFGLSWGAQLKLLLLPSTQDGRPHLLWRHANTQSTSWVPTAVTVPGRLTQPSRLMFEAVRGSNAYLDIALDALSILRGACHQDCVMQTCNFDTPNDLCGWSWIPTPTGARWIQKTGSSGDPYAGPVDDFSRPASFFSPFPGPTFPASHHTAVSSRYSTFPAPFSFPDGSYMLLDPRDAKPGQQAILLSPLSHSSGCLSLSLHYILRARTAGAAFIIKAVALGSVQKHTLFSGQPGSNWQPVSVNFTSKGQIQFIMVGVFGAIPEPAVAVDAVSIAPCGESFPQCDFEDDAHPFCDWIQESRDGAHWTRGSRNTSTQGTNHPSGGSPNGESHHYIYLKPDKLSQTMHPVRLLSRSFCALEAICVEFTYHMYGPEEGVMLKFLLGTPRSSVTSSLWSHVGSQSPTWQQASFTIPSGRQQPMQLILEAFVSANPTFDVAVGFILIHHGACPVPPTVVTTEKPTVPSEKPTFPTEECLVPTEKNTTPTKTTTITTEICAPPTEKPTVPTEKPTVPTEKLTVLTGKPTIPTEEPTAPIEEPTVPTEESTLLVAEPTIPTEKLTITETPTVPTEKPTISTEKPTVPTEKTTIPTEKPTAPTKKPTAPTEKPTVPTEKPTVPTEESTLPTEKPTLPTEETTVPTEKPTEKPTIPTEESTVPTEKPTVPTEGSTVPSEGSTAPTEKPTIPTGKPTVPTEKPTFPTEKPTTPTEKPTVPTEKPTVPTEKPTTPTEKPTVATEKPTVATEKPTVPTEKPTVPTEKSTVPTEKPTVPTEKPTVPTEKPTIVTEKPTVPTEKPTVANEKPTVATEKPTTPTGKPTTPTEKHTTPLVPYTSPTLKPSGPVLVTTPTASSAFMTSVALGTTATPRPAPVTCPSDAHYESCACPASCENPKPTCQLPCRPGCACNPGFLLSHSRCIQPSSCDCFYNNNYYKPGVEWFSPNCTEHCRCLSGGRLECQASQCGTHKVCQLQNSQYGCHPYGTATCLVYGDPHYLTFDERHFSFMGKCTYLLAHPCNNSTDPYFKVAIKNEERGQEGVSCLSKVYVTLPQTTITLLKGRHTLIGGYRVTLPAMPSKGIFLTQSGRFVELQTAFGLRVRWDGDQQLYVTVPSTYFSRVCGLCGNYDGDDSNDNQKPDGSLAQNDDELGNSWQIVVAGEEDKQCQQNLASPPSCDSALHNSLLGPEFCGRLIDPNGIFGACLPRLKAFFYYENCLFDMCSFQGLQQILCVQMSALTETCQAAGLLVKPWRSPKFCPLACPPNSRYSLCAKSCPDTCFSGFSGVSCPDRCMEGCECNPGFVLSGLRCVPKNQCGCVQSPGTYMETGDSWFKVGCKQRCFCEGNNKIRCVLWQCGPREACVLQDGTYGCHAQGTGTCSVSGDPHYLTFDGALHHFMGTCTYILARLCWVNAQESYFIVSATNENRDGNLEVSYVKAVHVQVFNLRFSLIKGRKVMLNDRRVALPVWSAEGRVSVGLSGSFILLQTDFGLWVRYDGYHLVDVTLPSSYVGRLCGLCGNYNNYSLDDNLRPDKKPAANSVQLGTAWVLRSASEPGCFAAGGKPPSCPGKDRVDIWNRSCEILTNPQGPFSKCHAVVSPHLSFSSCVYGQCGTQGDTLTLCHSLQAYAALCARAGRPPAWRNSTFCPLTCPPGSSYSPCASPCPATCLSMHAPRDCPPTLPCAEGCECLKGYILSGTSCVPLSQCGCTDQQGSYHPVGEHWYTDSSCSKLCTCSSQNNISCSNSKCGSNQNCWPLDGLLRCRASGMGVCHVSGDSHYVSFDGSYHSFRGTCTYILVQVCHPTMDLPFFKITAKSEKQAGQASAFYLHHVNIYIYGSQVTLQKDHRVLINGKQVTLPANTQIRRVSIIANGIYTVLSAYFGLLVKFDGDHLLEIQIPPAYYQKVCGMCGNFNGEEEDELMMPNYELAQNDIEFGNSWKDKDESNPSCERDDRGIRLEHRENPNRNCKQDDLVRAQEQCQAAFQGSDWSECATQVTPKPFVIGCTYNLCELRGENRAICDALQVFGVACQAKGLRPPFWRNNSFCSLECPAYSSYTHCAPTCPPSCWDLEGRCEGTKLLSTCFEGCVCNPGYVLKEDECILRNQCSCRDTKGHIFPAGKTWLAIGCIQNCVCTEGVIQCRNFHCPSGSHCQLNAKGNSNCVPDWLDHCSVSGDLHYRTLDGFSYHFQGRMTYTLVKTIDVLPDGVEPLVVEGRNKMYLPWSPVFLYEVLVKVYGSRIQLQPGLELVVNDEKVVIPYKPSEHLQVSLKSHRLYLTTDFGLAISFDGNKNAVISMPSTYQGLVRGLCGNFDRNQSNDLMLPTGAITSNINTFGNSWEVKGDQATQARVPRAIQEEEEKEGESSFHMSECTPEHLFNSIQACRVLADPQGPFAACHQTVAPEPFQEHCVLDQCAARDPKEGEELRCQLLSGYALICQEAGTVLASWRNHTGCALACPANTVYQSCMTPCPASCANPEAPRDCEGPCVEGCASLPGYVYSGAQSLPLADCGCISNGIYYQRGDSFVTKDCSQRCTCASSGVLLCEPLGCGAGEICTLGNLTRGCFRESPCLQNPCQNDGRCQEQGTNFTCECELGYGGDLCAEPQEVPAPEKLKAPNLAAVLLGMLVPTAFTVLAVTRKYLHRKRRRRTEGNCNADEKAAAAKAGPFKACFCTIPDGALGRHKGK